MAGRPPLGATFEVERVGRPRPRGGLAALAWVAVLGAVVGVAALGRSGIADGGVIAIASSDGSRMAPRPTRASASGPAIELFDPAHGPITLTGGTLHVYGYAARNVARVEVGLQGVGDRVLEQVDVVLQPLDRGLSTTGGASFRTDLGIPDPAPAPTMWVVVTAYDVDGSAIAFERRPFRVGAAAGA